MHQNRQSIKLKLFPCIFRSFVNNKTIVFDFFPHFGIILYKAISLIAITMFFYEFEMISINESIFSM